LIANGTPINNIRYADDTVILAGSLEDLQRLMNKTVLLKFEKTKFMKITKNQNNRENLLINNRTLEQVDNYRYLGTVTSSTNDYSKEIKIRIERARTNFNKLKRVLCLRDLKLDPPRCHVFSTLLYGMEAWILNAATEEYHGPNT